MTAIVIAGLATALTVLALLPPVASRLDVRDPVASDGSRRKLVQRWASAAATGVATGFASSWAGWWALLIAGLATVASFYLLGRLSSADQLRRDRKLGADLPQACDLLVVCLDAGLPIRAAAQAVAEAMPGPMGSALAEAGAKLSLGIDEYRAWAELAEAPPLAGLARELARGAATGSALSARVAEIGVEARRASAAAAQEKARKVGVRSVLPLMVCFLPSFVLLGLVPVIGGVFARLLG